MPGVSTVTIRGHKLTRDEQGGHAIMAMIPCQTVCSDLTQRHCEGMGRLAHRRGCITHNGVVSRFHIPLTDHLRAQRSILK